MIYAVFAFEEDFDGPTFKTIEEAQNISRTNSKLLIPVKKRENGFYQESFGS
jgi:hypothetical protein